MAYSPIRNLPTPQEIYAQECIKEIVRLSQISGGEEKLIAVTNAEALFNFFLEGEGAEYYQSKKKLLAKAEEMRQAGYPVSSLELANDLLKLQTREAKVAGIVGKLNLKVINEYEETTALEV